MSEQQKLNKVYYNKLKNLRDVEINFGDKNVTGIFGVNGSGKSTILHSLLCFYKPKDEGKTKNYKFNCFFKTIGESNWKDSEIVVNYSFRDTRGKQVDNIEVTFKKQTDRWAPKYSRRQDRDVFFIGIDSCVPDIEQEKEIINKITLTGHKEISYKNEILEAASNIMNAQYRLCEKKESAKKNSKKTYLYVERENPNVHYSSLSMGAGEQRLFKILEVLYNAPKYSLIIIDEIDLTLHTAALNRLVNKIVERARKMNLQVIFTSHREELTKMPNINIRHIHQTEDKTLCFENSTPECMDRLSGRTDKYIDIFVEDDLSKSIVENILSDLNVKRRVNVNIFGAASNAFSLGIGLDISKQKLDNVLIILDGDRYITEEEKKDAIKKVYTGTESYKEDRRKKVLGVIKQFRLPQGQCPEEFICNTLKKSSETNEIITIVKSIICPIDTHEYINEIISRLGSDRIVELNNIIKEFKKDTKVWDNYIKEIKCWLDAKIQELNLKS